MASVIKIKRSATVASPTTLASGELAYSWFNNTNKLYFGKGDNGSGQATEIVTIGGQYYTAYLDHTPGTLTASAAILVDSNSKINNLKVDNLDLDGNTISSTNTNGNIVLDPNGTGLVSINNQYTLPGVDGTAGYVLTTNGSGVASWAAPSTTLSVGADTDIDQNIALLTDKLDIAGGTGLTSVVAKAGTIVTITVNLDNTAVTAGTYGSATNIPQFTVDEQGRITAASNIAVATSLNIAGDTGTDSLSLLTDTLTVSGGEGIDVAVTNNTITVSGEDASTTNKGVASFDSGDFSVTNGAVSIKASGVGNSQLEFSTITVGSTSISLGGTSTSIAGVSELTVDNLNFNGNEISSTDNNGNISLNPNGTGTVDVNGARITTVGTPTQASDAATKAYVDSVAEGLHIHEAAHCATTDSLATLTSGSVTYNNGTDGVGATLTLANNLTQLDGHTLNNGDRILVKNESNQAHNGMYVRTSATVLTRADDFNTAAEIAGGDFTFVENGTLYAATGWVQIKEVLTVGTDIVVWQQFSGAGTFTAGLGLSLVGTQFDVNTANGIEVLGDNVQLASTVAGNGLTLTAGVLDVVGTADRITANSNSIDIASTYAGQSSITTLGTISTGTWQGTTVAVSYGGTGITTATARGILYGNDASPLGVTAASTIDGSFLREDSTGNPYWSNVVDGGTY